MIEGPIQTNNSGLVFYFDTKEPKSYVGEPTVNYSYDHNPRIDSSYSLWSPGYGGTFAAKHPDAIRVYNDAGSEITSYVNNGVTDWTNTYHAIWTYDYVLQRPVVTMRDVDGQWKAKYIYTGINFNSLGMTVGSKYTISWLQWTDNLSKRANVGLYTRNSSVNYNFWDGLSSGSSTSTNTLTNTWQRVYHTFTVTSNWNLSDSWNQIYMYGMDFTRATLKIADVQFELKDHPTNFNKAQTRSNTQGLLDLTGNYTIDLTNAAYDSSSKIYLSGSKAIKINSNSSLFSNAFTWSAWHYIIADGGAGYAGIFWAEGAVAGGSGYQYLLSYRNLGSNAYAHYRINNATTGWGNTDTGTLMSSMLNKWIYTTWTFNNGTTKIYINGVLSHTDTSRGAYNGGSDSPIYIGARNDLWGSINGYIDLVSYHNRTLTDAEILKNFNSQRSRYSV